MERTRLHIGSISDKLAQDTKEFEARIAKYGSIVSGLELHKKPILDTYYGYITLDIQPKKLHELRTAYNGVNYKGSKLTVNIAGPDYKQVWEDKQVNSPDPKQTPDELKRQYSAPPKLPGIINAVQRQNPRKDLYHATYRIIKKDGKKKFVKCSKKKLWGVDKNRGLDMLVFEYQNGQWKDAHGNTVETVDYEQLKEDDGQIVNDERDAAMKVLDQMFGGDTGAGDVKPIVFSDDDEEMGNVIPYEQRAEKYDAYNEQEQEQEQEYQEQEEEQEYSDNDDETLSQQQNDEQASEHLQKAGFNQAFSADTGGGLFGGLIDDDDIDENAMIDDDVNVDQPQTGKQSSSTTDIEHIPRIREPRGLFFPHFDSAFLSAQSQLAKIAPSGTFNVEAWEEELWSKRGEWSRESRRRKRDVVRQLKRKNMAKGRVY